MSDNMTKSVLETATNHALGLMFNSNLSKVVLIKKSRPAWQAGRLNGVGGHVESGESSIETMVREFQEETGVVTYHTDWTQFAVLRSGEMLFSVDVFYARSYRTLSVKAMTDEEVFVEDVNLLKSSSVVESLTWLVPLAIAKLRNEMACPKTVVAEY